MNCREFESNLMQWIDGAADAATAASMRAHEAVCDGCRGRGDAERAFERRVSSVLLAGTATIDAMAALRRAQSREAPTRGALHRLRRPRAVGAVAASLVVAAAGAWYLCIPPFECPILSAVEATAMKPQTAAEGGADLISLAGRVQAPDAILGLRRTGDVERIRFDLMGRSAPALRAHYAGAEGALIVVWCDAAGATPSFRRRTERHGRTWWIADVHQCNLVAFRSVKSNALCPFVSKLPEPDLLLLAESVRDGDR